MADKKSQYDLFILTATKDGEVVILHAASPNESAAKLRFYDTLTEAERKLGEPKIINLSKEPAMKKHWKHDRYFHSTLRK